MNYPAHYKRLKMSYPDRRGQIIPFNHFLSHMENQIEWKRRAHEEIDRLEACMVDLFLSNPLAGTDTMPNRSKAFKQKLLIEHQIASLQDQICNTSKNLVKSYDDSSSEDYSFLNIEGSDLGPFYSQLKSIKDYHRRQPPNTMAVDFIEIESILERGVRVSQSNLSSIFTGEERNGRFLDLYKIYDEAVNLIGASGPSNIDYLTFLQIFDRPVDYIPESKRTSSQASYTSYLDSLLNYLIDFVQRTRPISCLDEINFTLEELENSHKEALMELERTFNESSPDENLFCAPCDKLFTNPSVFEAHFKGKKHVKALETFKPSDCKPDNLSNAREQLFEVRKADLVKQQGIQYKELMISLYGNLLKAVKEATKGNVERRQALTPEERLAAEAESDLEDEQNKHEIDESPGIEFEDGRIYNPLKLPLDWDGKPIPFWLWKLHGLGVPYTCEICGNFVYMGRRAFDQHFYEWRHSHGMKCLGVPNTSHFFQITKIDEVKRLWDKMRQTAKNDALRPDWMEECEDASGNVYDRRTFEDLKRQGLI